jgi:glycosyltransferase involved in cell wall biosynthesis
MEMKPTRKTIYLNGRFLTQPITGVQRTAAEMVKALDELIVNGDIDESRWSFVLIYSGNLLNKLPLKRITLKKRGVLKGNLWEQLELPIYTWGKLLVSMCTISCLLKRKQIVFVHDAAFVVNREAFSFAFRTWYNFAIKALGNIALHIVTVSNFSKTELIKHVGFKEKKITVIYNAGEHILNFAEAGSDFKERIRQLMPYCLAVSSQSPNKNFNGLSNAIKSIDFKNYQMLIAGGISSTLKQVALNDAVKYLGYVSDEELKFLYSNASLFIFPSFYEGFGIPPLEAMVCGCPVVSSNTAAMPEVLGDGCFYCDPSDVSSIAEAIVTLINNPEQLATVKKKGYEIAGDYHWRKSAAQFFSLINKYA